MTRADRRGRDHRAGRRGSVGRLPATALDLRPASFGVQPALPRSDAGTGRPALGARRSHRGPQQPRHPDPRRLPIADLLAMPRRADGQGAVHQSPRQPLDTGGQDVLRPAERRDVDRQLDTGVGGVDPLVEFFYRRPWATRAKAAVAEWIERVDNRRRTGCTPRWACSPQYSSNSSNFRRQKPLDQLSTYRGQPQWHGLVLSGTLWPPYGVGSAGGWAGRIAPVRGRSAGLVAAGIRSTPGLSS